MRRWLALPFVVALAGVWLVPAMAQEAEPDPAPGTPTNVTISYDLGDFSSALKDWPVNAVLVEGDLAEGTDFTVEMRRDGGGVVWTSTQAYTGSGMRIPVAQGLAVGDIAVAGISQTLPLDPLLVQPEIAENPVQGGGGSTGQVATSMVLVIIIAVILFRTPLPSASTQRWTA